MFEVLNEERTVKIKETKAEVICAISRNIISKGETALRITRHKGDRAYGGVWVSLERIGELQRIIQKLLDEQSFEEKHKHGEGICISSYSPSYTGEDADYIKCSVCKEPLEPDQYTLSLSENYSYQGDYARIEKDCLPHLKEEILDLSNIQGLTIKLI